MEHARTKRQKVVRDESVSDQEVREPSTPPRCFAAESEAPKSAPLPATPKRGNNNTLPSPSRSLKRSQMSPLMLPKIQDHTQEFDRDDEFCDRPHNEPNGRAPSAQRLLPRMSRFNALKRTRREYADVAVELEPEQQHFPAVVDETITTPEIIPLQSPRRRPKNPLPSRDRPPK